MSTYIFSEAHDFELDGEELERLDVAGLRWRWTHHGTVTVMLSDGRYLTTWEELETALARSGARTIATSDLTEERQAAFIAGWEAAGGYTDDLESPAPWCCPWSYTDSILVTGDTPEEWGGAWWRQCGEEVRHFLAGEA